MMSKWHYIFEDEIICKCKDDPRAGKYMVYEKDVYNQIVHANKDYISDNDLFDEWEYLLDCAYWVLESYDGKQVYVPTPEVIFNNELEEM